MTAFRRVIRRARQVLNSHVILAEAKAGVKAGYRSQREQELDAAKYKDVCATLTEEYVDSCLANSFTALLGGECTTALLSSDLNVLTSGLGLALSPLRATM